MSNRKNSALISARTEQELFKHLILKWKKFVVKRLNAKDRSLVSRSVSMMLNTLEESHGRCTEGILDSDRTTNSVVDKANCSAASPQMPSTQYHLTSGQLDHAVDVSGSTMIGVTTGLPESSAMPRRK